MMPSTSRYWPEQWDKKTFHSQFSRSYDIRAPPFVVLDLCRGKTIKTDLLGIPCGGNEER
jgi:hypothetical protein